MHTVSCGRRRVATPEVIVRLDCVGRLAGLAFPGLRAWACAALALVLASVGCNASAAATIGPTVKEVVEFTRIVRPVAGDVEGMQTHISPDGRQAFIVTRRANTGTDRNRYQIQLLDMAPLALAQGVVRPPIAVATLEPELDNNSAYPSLQEVQWVGNGTLVFRARLADRVFQVYKVDVASRRVTQLTFAPTDVASYAVSQDLRRVVYTVWQDNPPMAKNQKSVVVANQGFWNVVHGQNERRAQPRLYQHFVAEAGSRAKPRALGEPFLDGTSARPPVSISPDGRWALLPRYEPGRHEAWARAYPLVAEATARVGQGVGLDPRRYFTGTARYEPRRLMAVRLSDGVRQPIVDAPDDTLSGPRPDVVWQAGGRSVIVAGTHLPLEAHGAQAGSTASHVIEYWPDSGRWKAVTALRGRLRSAHPERGSADGFVVVDEVGRRAFRRQGDDSWVVLSGDAGVQSAGSAWSLRLKEGLDVPPDAFAEGPAGQLVRLTDLNPHFSPAWGSMKPYGWTDAKGRTWEGGLMLPAGHGAGTRLPLVIQTYGFSPHRFYLDGSNTAIGYTSGFAGRAFLRENILVLAMPVRPSTRRPRTEPETIAAFMDGVRGAIEALVAEGLVDRERVGIMGWSMTGEHVLNLVTFSDVPIRAATMLDGDANTLFSLTVTYGRSDEIAARKSTTNEGLPFGERHANWIRNDPSLNTECIRSALRIETYGPWVLNNWDIHALLRQQYKPVEMVVVPGGSHGLMTPSDRMLSLQGNVDWFNFWLRGEERAQPMLWGEDIAVLGKQYRRWREMAELKQLDDARPICARNRGTGGKGQ